jgi:Glycosyltransferase Family 4
VTSADPPRPGALDEGRTRVATIPSTDPYLDAVLPPEVVRAGPGGDPSPWLDIAYLTEHAAEIDVLHLHTGHGHVAEVVGQCWTETVRRLGLPLVVTVHQLRPSSHPPRTRWDVVMDAHLEAVLATAEVVLTLTPGAADQIATRYGRTAIVVSHPSAAVPVPDLGAERGLVGVRLPSASSAVPDPAELVRAALSGAVSGGGRLRVLVDAADALDLDPGVRDLVVRGDVELAVHLPAGWPAELQQLHVAVLPERCGTHSRDLEICRDVGTRVVAPSCGWLAGQWSDVVAYGNHENDHLDAVSLTAAVSVALTRPMIRPADRGWRADQQSAVRQVHADVYAQVAADRSWA